MSVREIRVSRSKSLGNSFILLLFLVSTLVGYVEAGGPGAIWGLASALLCFLSAFFCLIPFLGIFVYFHCSRAALDLLASRGISIPTSQAISLYGFGILAGIFWFLWSILVLIFLLDKIFSST